MTFRETMAAEADRVSNKQQREIPEAVLCSENDSGSGTCHHQRQAEPDDAVVLVPPARPLRPHNRTISCAPRPTAVRFPRSRPPTAAPARTLPAQLWPPGLPRDGILPAVPGRGAGGLLRAPCATTTPIRY